MTTDNMEKVLTAKLRLKNNSANLLIKHRTFFFRFCDQPLFHKSSLLEEPYDGDEVWPLFQERLMSIYFHNPEKFLPNDDFDFLRAIISLNKMSEPDFDFSTINWVGNANFIDTAVIDSAATSGGVDCSFGILNLANHYEFLPKKLAYNWRDLMLSLVKSFDPVSNTFDQDWEGGLKKRAERKVERKKDYIAESKNIFTPRQLGKAFKDKRPIPPKAWDGKKPKISMTQWKKILRYYTAKILKRKGLKTSAEATACLLSLMSKGGFIGTLRDEISTALKSYSLPFVLETPEIGQMLNSAYWHRMKSPSLKDKAFTISNALILDDHKRLNRMKMPNRTKELLSTLIAKDGLLMHSHRNSYNHVSLYSLVVCFSNLKIPHKQIRPFLKSLYEDQSKDSPSNNYSSYRQGFGLKRSDHDTIVNVRSVYQFFSVSLTDEKYSRIYGKILEILTSHLNGGNFSQNIINQLNDLTSIIDDIEPKEFNSMASLKALIEKKRLGDVDVIALAKEKGFIVKDDDEDLVMGSGMPLQLLVYLEGLKPMHLAGSTGDYQEIIEFRIGDGLNIAVLPSWHLKGVLGASVQGVCIDFGSREHLQHLIPECRNLIVYDKHSILLWGLLVESKEGAYFLNNIQGSIPSRHVKHKLAIKDSIIKILGVLGKVYLVEQSFNSIYITDGLQKEVADEAEEKKMITLPRIRLDVSFANGLLPVDGMHYVKNTIEEPKKREAGLSSLMSRILPKKIS